MSYADTIPVGRNEGGWWSNTEEDREEFLADTFRDITQFDHERRHFHDRNGFYAEFAGEAKCLALGHVNPEAQEEGFYPDDDAYDTAMSEWEEGHPYGWDDRICIETRWGTACTHCEGECDYDEPLRLLWGQRGVLELTAGKDTP